MIAAAAAAAAAAAGTLHLRPGRALPTVQGARPELAPRLLRGLPPQAVPQRLGNLYTLCAHAHRLAARLVLAAAQGAPAAPTAAERRALRLGSARDQVLRMVLDWPRLLRGIATPTGAPGATHHSAHGPAHETAQEGPPDASMWLRSCPLWRPDLAADEQLAALPAWLQHKLLACPPPHWLQDWAKDGDAAAERWCRRAPGPVAAALAAGCDAARALHTATRPLQPLQDPQRQLPPLARAMGEAGFVHAPTWDGHVADTGPWTRWNDPAPQPARSAWPRLCSRLADLLRLAAPEGDHWLATGALPLGEGRAIAWVEMARGLLLHTVALESTTAGPRVADYRVLAPTDWNFHPQGLLARALVDVHAADDARCLALAFDPCLAFVVEPQREVADA